MRYRKFSQKTKLKQKFFTDSEKEVHGKFFQHWDHSVDCGDHVNHVLKKLSLGLSILKMSKNYLPQGTLKILYNSLIETHFCYGNIIWGNAGRHF